MTRDQKIKALKAIKEGQLSPQDLKPAQVFVFTQKERGDGQGWTSAIGEFTDLQLYEFIKEREEINHRRKYVGLPSDTIIKVVYENKAND